MAGAKNVSAEMKIWKDRIDSELKSAAEWEENWGFLKAPRTHDTPEVAPAGGTDLTAATPNAGAPSVEADSDLAHVSAKFKYTMNRSKTPKEKYSRPITTQQEVGWRPSLELFGVAKHGIRRSADLWPEK